MGDDIETCGSMSFPILWSSTTLVERKSKQTDIDDRSEPMSSPIINPAQFKPFETICAKERKQTQEALSLIRNQIQIRNPYPKSNF